MARKGVQPAVRKQPQRTCIACRETEGKRGLLRLVRTPEAAVVFDPTGKKSGRGAYVHAADDCIGKAMDGGGLARALKVEITPEVKGDLRRQLAARVSQE